MRSRPRATLGGVTEGMGALSRLEAVPPPRGTRVKGFSWDKRPDRLWRQGIDLIGDDGGDDLGEGIEDRTVFGKSERREFLDVTDDCLDNVAPREERLVEERTRQPLHVAAHPRHQGETTAEQSLREVFTDVAFVAKQFSD